MRKESSRRQVQLPTACYRIAAHLKAGIQQALDASNPEQLEALRRLGMSPGHRITLSSVIGAALDLFAKVVGGHVAPIPAQLARDADQVCAKLAAESALSFGSDILEAVGMKVTRSEYLAGRIVLTGEAEGKSHTFTARVSRQSTGSLTDADWFARQEVEKVAD